MMAEKKAGKQTVKMKNPPVIRASATIAGPKEGKGPLGTYFDFVMDEETWGEKSWEKAESKMVSETFSKLLNKAGITVGEIDYVITGDLLNQCIATSMGLKETGVPFIGIYGACSTMAESLSLGAMLIDGGFADNVVCITSSHFCSAEKQFRFPLELGAQRSPTSQWTVTGCGGMLLSKEGNGPRITGVTTGRIVDMGIKDINNMGGAMAPAAADTILNHFKDTGLPHDYYDLVITGDLGLIGRSITVDILKNNGLDMESILNDCGLIVYDRVKQDVHAGGSGCGCSAIVMSSYIYDEIMKGNLKKVLFAATGALLSTTSIQQGESIASIAHGVAIERI
jgi:stage V sporulation protein AD